MEEQYLPEYNKNYLEISIFVYKIIYRLPVHLLNGKGAPFSSSCVTVLSISVRDDGSEMRFRINTVLKVVQSLNSPFFPLHIGAEPGRAKEESRITCMRMLRTPPFFPPKSGEKPYLVVFSRFGLWRDFLNDNIKATISVFRLIKNMSINPKSVEFHQYHAKPHSIWFLSQYQR